MIKLLEFNNESTQRVEFNVSVYSEDAWKWGRTKFTNKLGKEDDNKSDSE